MKHRDILEKIDEIKRCQVDVIIEHVRGHSEDYGNKQADKLARRAIRKKSNGAAVYNRTSKPQF